MRVHGHALHSSFSALQLGFFCHWRPPSCQIQWTVFGLPSYLTSLWYCTPPFLPFLLEGLSPLASTPSSSLDFLFTFGRLWALWLRALCPNGLCSSPSFAACFLVAWEIGQTSPSQCVSSSVKWGFSVMIPMELWARCLAHCRPQQMLAAILIVDDLPCSSGSSFHPINSGLLDSLLTRHQLPPLCPGYWQACFSPSMAAVKKGKTSQPVPHPWKESSCMVPFCPDRVPCVFSFPFPLRLT